MGQRKVQVKLKKVPTQEINIYLFLFKYFLANFVIFPRPGETSAGRFSRTPLRRSPGFACG
ncbi:hypothetical protein HMPREF3150_05769 [Pseudomonas aeruginosa]|nr:hypothetical protein HMPREF3150_05769 [Pseudomonas aeruginosa]